MLVGIWVCGYAERVSSRTTPLRMNGSRNTGVWHAYLSAILALTDQIVRLQRPPLSQWHQRWWWYENKPQNQGCQLARLLYLFELPNLSNKETAQDIVCVHMYHNGE